jgi:hypothetical protein
MSPVTFGLRHGLTGSQTCRVRSHRPRRRPRACLELMPG